MELYENKFEIVIKTKKKLNNKQVIEVMMDLKARMEGYTSTPPKSLIGSEMHLQQSES